jgi:two-component system, NtrC family, sensor kinase
VVLDMQQPQLFAKSLSLRSKFRIGTAVILLVSCIISALLIYYREKALLEERAYAKTELVMAAVEASREYVREELRPRMYDVFGPNYFMLEAMSSSYVGRAVMDRFGRHVPDFQYRRVAINARNPNSEANLLETEMITYFKEAPNSSNWQGLAKIKEEAWYMRFEPVFFEVSCLHCHGDPRQAPADLIHTYGDQNGFGHYAGELAGIIAVGVPVHSALAAIKERAARVFMAVLLIVSSFYLILMFFFDRIVIHNLRSLLDIFKHEIEEEASEVSDLDSVPETSPERLSSDDELKALTRTGITMARNLRDTRLKLQRHALSLEEKVARRTRALQESQLLLQEKILTRDQELRTLNRVAELTTQTQDLQHIWRHVLNESLALIPARGAGVYLWNETHKALELVCLESAVHLPERVLRTENDKDISTSENSEGLPRSIMRAFDGDITHYTPSTPYHYLNVPIACRGSQSGVISFIESSGDPITTEQQSLLLSIGRQVGIALVSLTDRQHLLQSKELLQSVFDGITDMVMLLDPNYRIKMVNRAYLKRYNVTLEDVYDHPCYEAHSGRLEACEACGLKKAVAAGRVVGEEIRCADGALFLIQFYPVLDESGRLESIIRYAREITDQKRMELKIQQTEKLVAIGQLAAGVAHEINNPLGVILCYIDLLKRELADFSQGLKDLAVIEKQTLVSRRIVTDLLQFARAPRSTRHPTAINSLIRDVAQFMSHQFKKDKVSLILNLDENIPSLQLDVNKIKQVLINLLINACQAVSGEGKITVTSRVISEDRQIEIQVRDTGIGISPAIKTKIFDPFFTTKKSGDSTGLGLSVSYGIIQDHDGEITVESEPGRWTCFTIRFPLIDAE